MNDVLLTLYTKITNLVLDVMCMLVVQTRTTTAAESAQTLFQPRTIMYMWYGLGAWVIIFVAFVIWEFTHWRPKHKRRQGPPTLHTIWAFIIVYFI